MSVPTLLRSLFPLPRTTSWSQWATVYLAQGLIAGCIDGAINYFIARNMYGTSESSFWSFPLPVAGDNGVTCLVQGLATYLIVPSLVLVDVRGRRVTGLAEPWPRPLEAKAKERSVVNAVGSWVLEDQGGQGVLLIPWDLAVSWRAGELKGLDPRAVARRIGIRVASQVVKGVLWGAALFFCFWPLSVAILAPLYTHHPMTAPIPELVKCVFTFVIGFFQNYLVCLQTLGSPVAVYGRGYASVHAGFEGAGAEDVARADGERESLLPSQA